MTTTTEERVEERINEPAKKKLTAFDCENWKDGTCETCGVPWQYYEVSGYYDCPGPKRRAYPVTPPER